MPEHKARGPHSIPRGVWALGFVSMFMDISSEMIHSLLPVFLVSVLRVTPAALGVLEGVSEGAVHVVRMFSGALSDWLGKRKALALAGYGIAALTKPLFPLADSFGVVFAARLLDRAGKGIRAAPRDALIADLSPPQARGASYGLRQSLDSLGAFAGPLGAMLLMLGFHGDFRHVFWVAAGPAFISVAVLFFFVQERPASPVPDRSAARLHWRDLSGLSIAFWLVVALAAVFTLARFSEAFLILRAGTLGVADSYVPLVLAGMNIAYALSSYPAGRLSDRLDKRLILGIAAAALIIADVFLAIAGGLAALSAGICFWGLHMGFSQGVLAALIANAAPASRRGTAFGLFNLVTGFCLLLASAGAGALWNWLGPPATFFTGAGFATLALLALMLPSSLAAR